MVHLVKKLFGPKDKKREYLYIQKSYYNNKSKERHTEHVAYLGRADKYTARQLNQLLFTANNLPKKQLNQLLIRYNKQDRPKPKGR